MFHFVSLPDRVLAYQLYEDSLNGDCYRYWKGGSLAGETGLTNFTFRDLEPGKETYLGVEMFLRGTSIRSQGGNVATRPVSKVVRLTPPNEGLSTPLIQSALEEAKNGGMVVLSEGEYISGALFLPSHTCLKLEKGAVLRGSENPDDYPLIPSRFEGIEMTCYASLINAGRLDHSGKINAEDIVIYGDGAIYGGGNPLAEAIIARHEKECEGQELSAWLVAGRMRGRLIQLNNVDGAVIEGLDLGMSPSWNLHFIYSKNIVTANCSFHSIGIHNGDGWDPDSSSHCYLFHSTFDVGDDCVAIKSGKNPEGNEIGIPCTDIQVFDCKSVNGHSLALGSEMSGGIEGVRFFQCDFLSTQFGLHIKTTKKRGGYIRDVKARDCSFGSIMVRTVPYNDDGVPAKELPIFEGFEFQNITLDGIRHYDNGTFDPVPPITVKGFEEDENRFANMSFSDVRFLHSEVPPVVEYAQNVTIQEKPKEVKPMKVDSDAFSDRLVETIVPKLSYREGMDLTAYQKELRAKFEELLCIDAIKQNACELTLEIESVEEHDDFTQTRFTVETEKGNFVPCYLLTPKLGKKKYPLCIVLQGHTDGMHVSLGDHGLPGDEKANNHFGLQAVKEGYAALAIELRGRGEQRSFRPFRQWDLGAQCKFAAFTALTLGRTLEGERVWDVSKVIDVIGQFPEVDVNDIMVTGVSGGGTLSFYAACYDERIKLSAPDCAFCPYKESILAMYHCVCNHIPHAYEWFDMPDLSALIAPRKFLPINGVLDRIFPIDAARRGYETTKRIYEAAGVPQYTKMIETPRDHYWCEDMTWPAIKAMREVK